MAMPSHGHGTRRVFLSHKATVKVEVSRLKQSLGALGISAFVAHQDIEPTEEWQREIERALSSMHALVALLTSDFHDSNWTDQEVGVAIGRGVPMVSVRIPTDPYGLMGKHQALAGCSLDKPDQLALQILRLLHKRLPKPSGLFEAALEAYRGSRSFDESGLIADRVFPHFEDLTSVQIDALLEAYRTNRQNRFSFKGKGVLLPLLKRWTGEDWAVADNLLVTAKSLKSDEIPF